MSTYEELLLRYLDGDLAPDEESQVADLLRRDPEARAFLRGLAEQAVMIADLERAEQGRQGELGAKHNWDGRRDSSSGRTDVARALLAKLPWAVAAAAVVALVGSLVFLRSDGESQFAKVSGLNGSVQWTGNGGQVIRDLKVGDRLSGGMLEALSADSWCTLELLDSSTLTISGESALTVSQLQQKELHLRRGSLSANVVPQPDGKPMLIHTPTAELEVLGTQFNLEAERSSTKLNVNEGRIRVTRLEDGSVAEVPADHEIVAAVDRDVEFNATRRPEPVTAWLSELPEASIYGTWLPGDETDQGMVRANQMLVRCDEEQKLLKFYVVSLGVSRKRPKPVVLSSGATFHIRGRIDYSREVYFGLTMLHPKGGFAGKYIVERKCEVAQEADQVFDIELRAEDFLPQYEVFPDSPIRLELFDWWCCTYDVDAGLSVESVELVPAPQREAPHAVP